MQAKKGHARLPVSPPISTHWRPGRCTHVPSQTHSSAAALDGQSFKASPPQQTRALTMSSCLLPIRQALLFQPKSHPQPRSLASVSHPSPSEAPTHYRRSWGVFGLGGKEHGPQSLAMCNRTPVPTFTIFWPWWSYWTSLCLSFLTCKMAIIVMLISQGYRKDRWLNSCKMFRTVPGI